MCKDGEANGEKKPKNTRPQAFTPMNAKQAQEASVRARNLRKQMRAQLLDAAIQDAKIGDLFVKAIKTKDADLMKLVETGLKIVGLTHDQSEEAAAQKIDIKSDNKVATSGALNITFSDAKPET